MTDKNSIAQNKYNQNLTVYDDHINYDFVCFIYNL